MCNLLLQSKQPSVFTWSNEFRTLPDDFVVDTGSPFKQSMFGTFV